MSKKKKAELRLPKNSFAVFTLIGVVLVFWALLNIPDTSWPDSVITIPEESYSWGDIQIDGGNVEHEFKLINSGETPLEIKYIETSCVCTNAWLVIEGEKSPMFSMVHQGGGRSSWKGEIAPGQEATILAVFDPLFHGPDGTGPITRTIKFQTNDPNNSIVELRLDGDVI